MRFFTCYKQRETYSPLMKVDSTVKLLQVKCGKSPTLWRIPPEPRVPINTQEISPFRPFSLESMLLP
jgi:hypothetical protein